MVLLGSDLASGEALPEDLLRRVPRRLRSLVPANLGKVAHHQPRYDGHEPAQKRNKEYDLRLPVVIALQQKGSDYLNLSEYVGYAMQRDPPLPVIRPCVY